jgi:uncharacterized protein YceK
VKLSNILIALGSLFLMALASGCASITRGTTEAYAVQTNPPGAAVESSSGWHCTTPCSVKVKRRSDFVLTISKPGYETVTATVTSSIDGAGAAGMAGNVILGGIIGAGIDAGTGAMHSHKPNPLSVNMAPLVTTQQAPRAGLSGARSTEISAREYFAQPSTRTAYSISPTPSSQGSRAAGRVYLDDYDRVLQQVPARKRRTVVLGQDVESD